MDECAIFVAYHIYVRIVHNLSYVFFFIVVDDDDDIVISATLARCFMLPYSFFPVYWLVVVVVQCLKCSILQSPHSGRTLFPVESCERHKVIRLVHHLLYMTTVILLSSQLNSTQPLFVCYALCVFAPQSLHTFFFLSFYPIHSFDSPPTHSAIQVSATNFSDENDFISQFLVFSRFRWKFFFLLFFFFTNHFH